MTNRLSVLSLLLAFGGVVACVGDDPATQAPEKGAAPAPAIESPASCTRKGELAATETWSAAACPSGYNVTEDLIVPNGMELTIEAGTVIMFENNAGLTVKGALNAEGRKDKPIRFTGKQESKGAWTGIAFESSSPKNRLAFVRVDSAGGGPDSVYRDGAVQLGSQYSQSASAEIVDSEIVGNAHFGLGLRRDAKLVKLERVTIKDNTDGVAHVLATSAAQMTANAEGNVFEADAVVMIETHIQAPIAPDSVWASVSPAKYRVVGQNLKSGDFVYVKNRLTITEGTTIEFAGGAGFLVQGGTSGLNTNGTAEKPIVLRGIGDAGWSGITFAETTAENSLSYTEVKNATNAPEAQSYGTNVAPFSSTSIMLGYRFTNTQVKLTLNNVTFSGASSAPFDVTKKPSCILNLEGTNLGAKGGALAVQNIQN